MIAAFALRLAEARAGGLRPGLYRVSRGGVARRYIGETEKNLGGTLMQVDRNGGILFFDEGDALFARRTEVRDAHDRHANTDTLSQR